MTIKIGIAVLPRGLRIVARPQVLSTEDAQRLHEAIHARTGQCVALPTITFPLIQAGLLVAN